MSATSPQIVDLRPLTPEELDLLSSFTIVSSVLGVLALLCVVVAASLVATKTRLPGRYSVLASVLLLPIWWGFEQSMGGSLEMTFGTAALLITAIAYALFAILFSVGFVRMCMGFLKNAPVKEHDG